MQMIPIPASRDAWHARRAKDEGVCERRQRGRGPYRDGRGFGPMGFFWAVYALTIIAGFCIFWRVLF